MLQATMKEIRAEIAATERTVADLRSKFGESQVTRADLLISGTAADVRRLDAELASISIQREMAAARIEKLRVERSAAEDREKELAIQVRHDEARTLAKSYHDGHARYADLAAELAALLSDLKGAAERMYALNRDLPPGLRVDADAFRRGRPSRYYQQRLDEAVRLPRRLHDDTDFWPEPIAFITPVRSTTRVQAPAVDKPADAGARSESGGIVITRLSPEGEREWFRNRERRLAAEATPLGMSKTRGDEFNRLAQSSGAPPRSS